MFTFLLFLSIATVANGDTNLRSNAQVQESRCKNTDLSKDTNLLNRWCQTHPWLNNGQYCMWQCPEGELKITCRGNQGWEKQRCKPAAPQGTKFYAIMGKISGRKNKLAPGIGVHCLDRGTTKATEAPYDGKVWGEKHGALSVQCCGADNYRDDSDPLKKVRPTFYLFSPALNILFRCIFFYLPQSNPIFFFYLHIFVVVVSKFYFYVFSGWSRSREMFLPPASLAALSQAVSGIWTHVRAARLSTRRLLFMRTRVFVCAPRTK